MKPAISERYSYRADKAVPAFDDRGPIVFMDGHCVLCTRAARIISQLDRADEFRICPVQSPLGRAVLEHYRFNPDDPESWLYLVEGYAYHSMDAIIRSGTRLGGWGRLAQIFRILPRPIRDWLYRRIARNRYSIGGRTDMCAVPDPALRRRLMT